MHTISLPTSIIVGSGVGVVWVTFFKFLQTFFCLLHDRQELLTLSPLGLFEVALVSVMTFIHFARTSGLLAEATKLLVLLTPFGAITIPVFIPVPFQRIWVNIRIFKFILFIYLDWSFMTVARGIIIIVQSTQ